MDNKCLLDNPHCKQRCAQCGWNPEEAKLRKKMVADNQFTICDGGIKKLIIKRKASEE